MTTALDDRAGIVFSRGFYMPRVHCVQVGLSDDLARLPPPEGAIIAQYLFLIPLLLCFAFLPCVH